MFRLAVSESHRENPWWELGGAALWRRLLGPRPPDAPEEITLASKPMHAFLTAAKRIEGWYTSSDIEDTPITIEPI